MNLTAQSLKDEFLGRICVTPQGDRSLLNQRLARLTPVGASSEFAFWVFKSPVFRRFVDGLNTGSLIQHMFTSNIYEFVFPMPPLMEQAVLVERLDDVHRRLDALRSASGRSRNRLVAVDQAVLAKGFRGELVPQNRDDEPALALLGRAAVGKCEQST
jgi:type I restriction enzyme S subunit